MATAVMAVGSTPREAAGGVDEDPVLVGGLLARLVRRHEATACAPSCTPTPVLVLPTSSSRSTGDLPGG
jgi:hypothetical protein